MARSYISHNATLNSVFHWTLRGALMLNSFEYQPPVCHVGFVFIIFMSSLQAVIALFTYRCKWRKGKKKSMPALSLLENRCPEGGELLCCSHGDRDELDTVLPDPSSSATQGSLHHLASYRPEVLFQSHDHSR